MPEKEKCRSRGSDPEKPRTSMILARGACSVHSREKAPKFLVMWYTYTRSALWSDRQLELCGLRVGVLDFFPQRGLVNKSEHRLIVTRITRLNRPLVLSTIKAVQPAPCQPWSSKPGRAQREHVQLKIHLAHHDNTFASFRSNSIDGSLMLFLKCHNDGPANVKASKGGARTEDTSWRCRCGGKW
jgi:hypothetical protein